MTPLDRLRLVNGRLDPFRPLYRAEGTTEFSALLYLPSKRPHDIFYQDYKIGPTLYVRRVQIMDHCEAMLPTYLRFVKGVVESSDLPLNVSREILQENKVVNIIKKNLTKKVLDTLAKMKADDAEAYAAFYAEFGRILKEGIHHDFERRETIADLMLVESTTTEPGKTTTLAEYVERMGEDQKEIYYITGSDRISAEASPYLEVFKEKGIEVLIMTDDFDDIIISGLGEYQEKPFQSAIKGDLDLGETDKEEQKKEFGDLLELMKEELKDLVSEVRISGRLKDSAVCLVAGEHDLDPKMAKMFEAMGQAMPKGQRVLEVNPDHQLIARMKELFDVELRDPDVAMTRDELAEAMRRADVLVPTSCSRPTRTALSSRNTPACCTIRLCCWKAISRVIRWPSPRRCPS